MKSAIKSSKQDMTEGKIIKGILLFSIPLLIGNLFQQLYNTVDSIIAGNFIGKEALAAVGSSNSLINLIVGLFMGIATGAGVVISQYYGARAEKGMQEAVHTSITISIIGGIVLTGVGVVLSPQILVAMGTPQEVMDKSITYLRIFFCGSVFNILYNMGAGILRGVGDSKRPLYYLCVSSVVNIILDIIFVVVFHMGVAGTAWANVINQVVSEFMVVRALMRDDDIYRLHLKKLGISRIMLKRVLMMGIPSGIQNAIISFSNVVVQANINSFGADAMAGCSSYMKIDGFVILPIMSFGMAAMTFTGQNVGAGKRERVKKGAANTLMIGLTYTVAVTILLLLFGQIPLRVFSSDVAVNQNGYLMLRTVAPFYVTLTVAQVMTGVFRGAGKAVTSMLLMVGSMVGIRMLWVNIMVLFYPDLETVLWGYPVSWVFAMLGVILYAWKGKWLPEQGVSNTL
ncbi:MATE family efflux transporter [Robinsoniella peoriensis]|uniref:MATE family efflux transporter n=1 Tax=Robinsoniella peoriensis TaxID=180332 RepID=UPI00375022C1